MKDSNKENFIEEEINQTFFDLFDKGREYYNNQQFTESVEYLQKALEVNPKSDISMNFIGEAYVELKNIDKAIEYFKLTIEENPKFISALNNLGK